MALAPVNAQVGNLNRDPRATVVIFDAANPFDSAQVQGTASIADDPDGILVDVCAPCGPSSADRLLVFSLSRLSRPLSLDMSPARCTVRPFPAKRSPISRTAQERSSR